MGTKLADYIKTAGLRLDNPSNPGQGKAAESDQGDCPKGGHPAPQATQESRGEAPGGHAKRDDHTDPEHQDTGAAGSNSASQAAPAKEATVSPGKVVYDPALIKTAEQKWCLDQGYLIPDPSKAAQIYQDHVKTAELQKQAEEEKVAREIEARGAVMYQGMVKESASYQLATGQIDMSQAAHTAQYLGCSPTAIVKRAQQIKSAMTDVEIAATPNDVFFAGQKGMAARTGSSEVLQGAARNNATTEFTPEATQGTRQPAQGPDENTQRFVDTATLPGNPGLNHGQQVDQGKGLGE